MQGRRCLDGVLAYVAREGYWREAGMAFGVNSVAWRLDVELRWVTVRTRHGKWRQTRLHWACWTGLLPRVIELLEWKSDIEAADKNGNTPLHLASRKGHLEVVRELVRRGAKVGAKTKIGSTPLHDASFNGHVEVARLLLDSGADIEAKGNISSTPLYQASQEGKLEVVQLLVARGAVVDTRIVSGGTPLMVASAKGHAPVVRALLAAGADVRARNNRSWTALHMASLYGRTEALRELLKSDEAELNAQDAFGTSPLMDACAKGHLMAATLLIGHGADVNVLNHAGESALHLAKHLVTRDAAPPAAGAEARTAAQLEEHKQVVALLKAHGAT